MLFMMVVEGRFLIVELGGFGLWWRHNDMTGSKMDVVSDMLMGALVLSVRIGIKGSMMMMTIVVVCC
jgi:hypothetical protein